MGEGPPNILPSLQVGVEIVETVEQKFISGGFIRDGPPSLLGDRCEALVKALQGRGLITSPGFADMYVAALYSWHGCLNMAKCLRRTYETQVGRGRIHAGETPRRLCMAS